MSYMPGDSRLVDEIVFELKSQGIFDQFRKECIADVDTKPAYQNLRQRVEGSVTGFLSRQHWKPDLNKNQLREKLRKHIHDSNFLDQGVERIVDQVVNPKVSSVFIPQVEDVVYNYLGIERPRMSSLNESSYMPKSALHIDTDTLLPNDLEAVSPDSVKSNDSKKDKNLFPKLEDIEKKEYVDEQEMVQADIKHEEKVEECKEEDMVIDEYESPPFEPIDTDKNDDCTRDSHLSGMSDLTSHDSDSESVKILRKTESETFKEKLANHSSDSQLSKLSKGSHTSEGLTVEKKKDGGKKVHIPAINSESEYKHSDDESSSDLDLRRNVSPLTPVHNYNNENSCDAQQAFEQISHSFNVDDNISTHKQIDTEKDCNTFSMIPVPVGPDKLEEYEPSETMQKTSDYKTDLKSQDVSSESDETQGSNFQIDIPEHQKISLTYQFKNQMNLNEFAQSEDDSSCSNNLRIDYESDHKIENSSDKDQIENKGPDLIYSHVESEDKLASKEDKKYADKSSHHKSSRDSHRHSSSSRPSKDKKSGARHHSSSRDHKDSYRTDRRHGDKSESSSSKSHRKDSSRSDKPRDRHDSHHNDKKDVSKERNSSHSYKNTPSSHRDSSGHRDPSTHRDSRDSKSHKSHSNSSTKYRHSSSSHKSSDDRKSSLTSERSEKQNRSVDDRYSKISESSRVREKDRHTTSKDKSKHSSTSYSDKDRKYSKHSSDSKSKYDHESSKKSDKKAKKIVDDHYGASGRAGKARRSTDRDSNDGNSNSSKGSNFIASSKSSSLGGGVNDDKNYSSKSGNNSGNDSTGQSEKVEDAAIEVKKDMINVEEKILSIPVMRLENQLNTPVLEATKLPPIPEVDLPKLKKPRIASNIHEARKLMKVRKQMEVDELKRQQEIALKMEIQENVQPNASQVFSGISGPELEFACFTSGSKSPQHLDADNVTHIEQTSPDPDPPTNGFTEEKQSSNLNADLLYFEDREKDESMTQFETYKDFMDSYIRIHDSAPKLYLYNCSNYGKELFSAVCDNGRKVDVINLHRNGVKSNHRNQTQNIMVKNVFVRLDREVNILANKQKHPTIKKTELKTNSAQNIDLNPYVKIKINSEISDLQKTPIEVKDQACESDSFDKSLDNSFELVNAEYYSKIDDLMNNTSKQEIMEIILGGGMPANMSIASYPNQNDAQSTSENVSRKRKYSDDVEPSINNNHDVPGGGKMRKVSSSDQISSTTDDNITLSSQPKKTSRYTGKARRVGLPKPRHPINVSPSSPSSDRSVENYIQNDIVSQRAPDKWLSDDSIVKVTAKPKMRKPKATIQRYDTSDLYKPKPHFLSRRSNIS